MNADLRLLRYFVAVAEELNFTRAASRLHMAQQPLSAAIRRFEADLGVELFNRTTRQVELTAAGRALLEPARTALRAAEDAVAAARAAGRSVAGDLRFGLSLGARYGLEHLFAALAEQHPALHLHVRHDSAAPLVTDVQEGRLDLAVTFAARVPDDLRHERLLDAPMVLATSVTHRLADRESVALAELRAETWALDVPGDNPDYDSAVVQACRQSGFEPRTRASSAVHHAWELLIRQHQCVGLTASTFGPATHRDLRVIQLCEALTFPIDLIWRDPARPAVAAVVDIARQVCERARPGNRRA